MAYVELSNLDVERAIALYDGRERCAWCDWANRTCSERGVVQDPFLGLVGLTSVGVSSMPVS